MSSKKQIQVNYLGYSIVPVGFSTKKHWYEQHIAVYDEDSKITQLNSHLAVVQRTAYDEGIDFDIPKKLNPKEETLMFDEFIKPRFYQPQPPKKC